MDIHNWSSSAHQEIHKIVKDEIFPIVNQVDARVQNFKIQFLKEAAKFIRDFKSLAKEADQSLAKDKALELEIEHLLRTVVSHDIMSIVQNLSIENEYAKLWNDWYKKCEECKNDKILYEKAYNDMQQKIERLQAQLGDQKGKSKDTLGVSNTLDPLSQKLENKNVELEFQISKQKDTTKGTSVNTQFCKQSILGKPPSSSRSKLYVVTPFPKSKGLPKIDKTYALSKPVTSNSVSTPQESKVMKNDNVIAPGMFRINPFKPSKEEKYVPNKVRASIRTNLITISQPQVITKKDVNSDSNGLSSIGVDNTDKTRRPHPRSNTKNDRVPFASKSSCSKNKEVKVKEHPRNLLLSKNKKHMSSKCNNVKLAIQNDKSELVCAMCKQCLITSNHDVCVLNYVNDMNSRGKKQKENISKTINQKKQKPKVMKPKKVESNERLALPKPSKPRSCLRWSPTGSLFDLKGRIIESSKFESQSDCSNGDNACTSNPPEPTIKRFPNSTSFLGRNNHVAAILGFGDLQWRNILITRVYFVEGLGHNLFSVGQFCDSDLEAEAIATACYTQNRSIIHRRFNKTPYELINGKKPDISFLYAFGALCYPKIDREDIRKLGAKGDIGFFIGYSADSSMAFEHSISKPGLQSMTSGQISSKLDLTYAPSTITTQKPIEGEFDLLFEAMYDDYIGGKPSAAPRTSPAAQSPQVIQTLTETTTTVDTASTLTNSSSQATNFPNTSQDVDELETQQHVQHQPTTIADNVPNAMFDENTFVNPFATLSTSAAES
ncbi:retrovirus-related pol polyprotein from transposon TNT 1-94 [Tanacetum coccineum]|uniref:Retrovirus-related pol polyprotein from transposon TNT 1-94 n=1 Tax=Tanacetum coccineum TaxID=301880 RepID=A0ABQ5FNG7_9ASTR